MTIALYMDEHVHRAMTAGLRLRGVDVLTAQDDGRRKTADDICWIERPSCNGSCFHRMKTSSRRPHGGTNKAFRLPASFTHQLRVAIGVCVRELELIAKAANPEDLANRGEYLPL